MYTSALMPVGVVLCWPVVALCQVSATASQTLNLNLGANAKIAVVQSAVNLSSTGPLFSKFAGSVTLQYKIRTSVGTGSSSITTSATGEFSPSSGPRIADGDLSYTCGAATLGVPCSGVQTVGTSSQSNVVTVGSGACTGAGCSGADPNTVTVQLDLANSPTYRTGTYSTGLTFTISSI